MKFKYSEIQPNQLEEASSLILRTYLEYNTDGLSDESIEEFKRLTTAEYFKEWLDWKDKLPKFFNMWVCTDEDTGKIVGVSVGYYDKLDNLFVDRRYHRKGIAKRLFEIMLEYFNPAKMRVFSSLYAQDFYRKLGFVDVEEQLINKGQRVIFMTYDNESGEQSHYVELTALINKLTEKFGEEKTEKIIAEAGTNAILKRTDLTKIPGIGKKMAQHLIKVGYHDIESLKGQDPEEIYTKHCSLYGAENQSCRCVLYCYRLAVHYADNDGHLPPDKQNWSDWKD